MAHFAKKFKLQIDKKKVLFSFIMSLYFWPGTCTCAGFFTQRFRLTFLKGRLLATFNCKMVAIKKIQLPKPKKHEGEDTSWHITLRKRKREGGGHYMTYYWLDNAPNGTFSTLYCAAVSLRIHVEFLNDKRGKEKDRWCCRLYYWLNSSYYW